MKTESKVVFSARILAADNDGNIYLYLGGGSIEPYNWTDDIDQVWFGDLDRVDLAIGMCGVKPKYRIQKDKIEYMAKSTTIITKVITR